MFRVSLRCKNIGRWMSGRSAGSKEISSCKHCHIETVLGHDSSIPGIGELRACPGNQGRGENFPCSNLACNDNNREL